MLFVRLNGNQNNADTLVPVAVVHIALLRILIVEMYLRPWIVVSATTQVAVGRAEVDRTASVVHAVGARVDTVDVGPGVGRRGKTSTDRPTTAADTAVTSASPTDSCTL